MYEIKCPHCKKEFTVDEVSYNDILRQVKTKEFDIEVHEKLELVKKQQDAEMALVAEKFKSSFELQIAQKDKELVELKSKMEASNQDKQIALNQVETEMNEILRKKEDIIKDLEAKVVMVIKDQELEVQKKLSIKEIELNDLRSQLKNFSQQKELIKQEAEKKMLEATMNLNDEINTLKLSVKTIENNKELEVSQINAKKEQEIAELNSKISLLATQKEIEFNSIKESHRKEMMTKDDTIAFYKDLKARQSTKLVGESLEQHCEIEFNKIRATSFKNAIFTKDNDARTGSKGDYIYREFDENKNEIISIMFEMKNEGDETATKKKNEHFYKELDKDRNEKNCEYAILVSLLENDSELFNSGIVDVSYEYDKMYVVRPQFFIPIITLLRNAALNALEYKQELALIREQNLDITNFEKDLNNFKMGFARNYDLASRKFKTAIDEIDKAIKALQKTKDELLSSEDNLRLANNKAEDLTIKKLTSKNPTMKAKFESLITVTDDKVQ
jgi:hypothetical protein